MNITRQYRAFAVHEDENNQPILDDEGAMYFKPHTELNEKLFANPSELFQHIRDCEIRISKAQFEQVVADQKDLDLIKSIQGKTLIVLETLKYF